MRARPRRAVAVLDQRPAERMPGVGATLQHPHRRVAQTVHLLHREPRGNPVGRGDHHVLRPGQLRLQGAEPCAHAPQRTRDMAFAEVDAASEIDHHRAFAAVQQRDQSGHIDPGHLGVEFGHRKTLASVARITSATPTTGTSRWPIWRSQPSHGHGRQYRRPAHSCYARRPISQWPAEPPPGAPMLPGQWAGCGIGRISVEDIERSVWIVLEAGGRSMARSRLNSDYSARSRAAAIATQSSAYRAEASVQPRHQQRPARGAQLTRCAITPLMDTGAQALGTMMLRVGRRSSPPPVSLESGTRSPMR